MPTTPDDEEFFEIPDEEEPEKLRKKWEAEELEKSVSGKQSIACPHCQKTIQADSFSCLYCGERVFEQSGPIGWLATALRSGWLLFVVAIVLASFFFLSVAF